MADDKLAAAAKAATDAPGTAEHSLYIAYIARQSILELAMAGLMVWWVIYFVRVRQRRPELDPADFLTGDNGRYSLSKAVQAGAFVFSSMGLLHMLVASQLTEWYFGAYMVAWAGANAISRWTDASVTKVQAQSQQPNAPITNVAMGNAVQTGSPPPGA